MSRMRIPVILVVVHLVVLIILARTWYSAQPQSYMDEIFHVPQAQRYCQGDYWTWDPKLTTPPALYVISNLLLFATGQRPICSTLLLRLTNLIYPFLTLYALVGLLKELHPRLNYQERFTAAAVVICLPTLYFFNLMYYTDGGSTAFVLISWLAAKRRHHFLAALGSAVAVTFRQTNIIWSLFILGTTLLELAEPEERRHYDPKAAFIRTPLQLVNALNGFIHMLISRIPIVLVISIPYFGLLTAFATFVKWNGGIVLGDRSNHVPTLHLAQLLYFSAFTAGLSIFAILGAVPLARLLPKFTLRSWLFISMMTFTLTLCIRKFTVVHPFLLADNRHYTFYIWKLLSKHNGVLLYALVPFSIVAAWFCWQALATEQTILWLAVYGIATALTLIPSPLLEFRYFIIPYLIYRLAMRQPRGVWLALEFITYTIINAFTIWMFLKRPFRWAHEEGVQRFMW